MELKWKGSFWNFMANFNINVAGFIIVGMFVVTWAAALTIWKYGHIEEKWSAKLKLKGIDEVTLDHEIMEMWEDTADGVPSPPEPETI
jgi:hypothetical protein